MRACRVLLVAPLAGIGGTELSTLSLARGLKQAGHEVCVMCNAHPLVEEFRKAGVEIIAARMERSIRGVVTDSARMRRCIAGNQADIIHFQSAFPILMAVLARRAIRTRGVKVIWTCRGVRRSSYFIAGRTFDHVIDQAIANCDYVKGILLRNGLSPHKVRTVYNTPNLSIPKDVPARSAKLLGELGIDPRTPIVGTASRLSEERGVQYFIHAAALVHRASPGVRFLVAGGGSLEGELRRQAAELNMEGRVLFLGPRRDMADVYSVMDVFVNPCFHEHGTGNTNSEAMAFGKPVVAARNGGIPELVQDGVTGYAVPVRDARALADATLRLLRDPNLANRMGDAGRERILRDFTLERLVREVEAVYASVLGRALREET